MKSALKLLLYVVGGILAAILATFLLLSGPSPENNFAVAAALVVLFAIAPLGGFWMIYKSIRCEKKPFPIVFLAFIPFTFLWYYFERVRSGVVSQKWV